MLDQTSLMNNSKMDDHREIREHHQEMMLYLGCFFLCFPLMTEAATGGVLKKVFLKSSRNS